MPPTDPTHAITAHDTAGGDSSAPWAASPSTDNYVEDVSSQLPTLQLLTG